MRSERIFFLTLATVATLAVSNLLNVSTSTSKFTESYPAVVCSPNLSGLSSAISLENGKAEIRKTGTKSMKTRPAGVSRYAISSQSAVIGQMWFHTIAMVISSTALIQLAQLPVWVLCVTVLLGAIFTFQLFALKESSDNYDRVAAGIFHWSITYLSLLSVLLVAAQLLSA